MLAHPEYPWVCWRHIAASGSIRFRTPISFSLFVLSCSLKSSFPTLLSQLDHLISSSIWIVCLPLTLLCSHSSRVVLCFLCCEEPEAARHVSCPPAAWLLVWSVSKCGSLLSSSSSPFSHWVPCRRHISHASFSCLYFLCLLACVSRSLASENDG